MSVVSSPEIYLHEWASFSTADFPENRRAGCGDRVKIVMLDVTDRRPVEDVVCCDATYRRLHECAGLSVIETLRPLGRPDERVAWKSETAVAPWTIYVLGRIHEPAGCRRSRRATPHSASSRRIETTGMDRQNRSRIRPDERALRARNC